MWRIKVQFSPDFIGLVVKRGLAKRNKSDFVLIGVYGVLVMVRDKLDVDGDDIGVVDSYGMKKEYRFGQLFKKVVKVLRRDFFFFRLL